MSVKPTKTTVRPASRTHSQPATSSRSSAVARDDVSVSGPKQNRRLKPSENTSRAFVEASLAPARALTTVERKTFGIVGIRSKVTSKAQTTIPTGVRNALHVRPGDEIEYVINGDEAVIRRAAPGDVVDEDPSLLGFLDLIERDIHTHPERALSLSPELLERIRLLAVSVGRRGREERIDGPVDL